MSLQTLGKKAPTSLDSLGATVFSGVSASSASRLCKRSRICFADVRQPRLPRTSSKRGPDGLQALWPRPVVEKVKKVTELRTSLWFICSDFWAKPEPIWGPSIMLTEDVLGTRRAIEFSEAIFGVCMGASSVGSSSLASQKPFEPLPSVQRAAALTKSSISFLAAGAGTVGGTRLRAIGHWPTKSLVPWETCLGPLGFTSIQTRRCATGFAVLMAISLHSKPKGSEVRSLKTLPFLKLTRRSRYPAGSALA